MTVHSGPGGGRTECGASADGDGGNASHSAHLLELIRRRSIVKATEPLPHPPNTPRGSAKPRIPLAGLVCESAKPAGTPYDSLLWGISEDAGRRRFLVTVRP